MDFRMPISPFKLLLTALSIINALLFSALPCSAQSLLETWAFLENTGWFDINDLKENPPGTLVMPYRRVFSADD